MSDEASRPPAAQVVADARAMLREAAAYADPLVRAAALGRVVRFTAYELGRALSLRAFYAAHLVGGGMQKKDLEGLFGVAESTVQRMFARMPAALPELDWDAVAAEVAVLLDKTSGLVPVDASARRARLAAAAQEWHDEGTSPVDIALTSGAKRQGFERQADRGTRVAGRKRVCLHDATLAEVTRMLRVRRAALDLDPAAAGLLAGAVDALAALVGVVPDGLVPAAAVDDEEPPGRQD